MNNQLNILDLHRTIMEKKNLGKLLVKCLDTRVYNAFAASLALLDSIDVLILPVTNGLTRVYFII
jgi:hypothetical protein